MFFANQFGKYRAIVISVAMFIFLDTGVLGLNFYISSQIAADAVNVNLAGRQRMLSQKSVKALLEYRYERQQGQSGRAAYEEMAGAIQLFDRTLLAFKAGGETLDTTGQPIYLPAVETPKAISAVDQSLTIWEPIRTDFNALNKGGGDMEQLLNRLVSSAESHNLTLLKLMNDLTNDLEAVAKEKSETLRLIQASAITLAILNFFLILFHFIGQLRQSDSIAETARKETTEILQTVREGLLLLDNNLIIGTQHSESVRAIFGDQEFAGMSFRSLLHNLVVGRDMSTTEEYIKLLLNEKVKENLIGSLNPLTDVEVSLPAENGGYSVKHLSFRFNRTIEDGHISHILVTVMDVTETIALRKALDEAQQSNGLQLDALKNLVHLDTRTLADFLRETDIALHEINDTLKDEAADPQGYNAKLQNCFRIMHRIKGDAGALQLPQVVQEAHQFEEQLQSLQKMSGLQGSDFLPLTLALDAFLRLISDLQEVSDILKQVQPASSAPASSVSEPEATPAMPLPLAPQLALLDREPITQLAERIAEEQSKEVNVIFDTDDDLALPDQQRSLVQSSVIQLVRNAVVHGIELPEIRVLADKSPVGRILVRVRQQEDGLRISVRDDGHGLDLDAIREQAHSNGLYDQAELESFSRTRLMGLIFHPGFSTADNVDEHAGRGVGMDLVRSNVNKLKGRIRIGTQAKHHCEISFLIPVAASMPSEEVDVMNTQSDAEARV